MSTEMEYTTPADEARQTRRSLGWILLLGVLLSLLGLYALGHLVVATVASILMIGIVMMFGGISHIIFA